MTIQHPESVAQSVEVDPGGSTLAIHADQRGFTPTQAKALEHIGVADATDGDLGVFFHVCQRSGLDPFARQIYMIGRQESQNIDGTWVKVTKQTIQTGIDGYRLIGRRAADRAGHKISVSAPEWVGNDGQWRPVWSASWGLPMAARVTIRRDGEPFTGLALFDEYKQTKRDGGLTRMWAQRPAGQLAKCAEALAWRMAFPQDLSGIYTDDEMGQADNPPLVQPPATGRLGTILDSSPAPDRTGSEPPAEDLSPAVEARAGEDPFDYRSGWARGRFFPALRACEDADEGFDAKAFMSQVVGREVTSSKELTAEEAQEVYSRLPHTEIHDAEIVEEELPIQ